MSGNAETLAGLTASRLSRFGIHIEPVSCASVDASMLAQLEIAIFIASTWGDGQPPIDAREFWRAVTTPDAPSLPALKYAVLALGNRPYSDFCAFGRNLDEALARRGATRLLERVECDQWLRVAFEEWLEQIADKIEDLV
jgi:sulfite reductase (NADPH) flavoprotein alpha-component